MNARGIFCNRTLNLRAIRAIGYDMDYTLIHYRVEEWETRAYEYLKQQFMVLGWPVEDLRFDPAMVSRGLIIDTEQGNLVKANRFGFIKRASHGTQEIAFEKQRELYSRTVIDLSDKRWIFLNTLFSLSEGCMYAQLVDLLDQRRLPEVLGYTDLYRRVSAFMNAAHTEGRLKAEIIADPDRFVVLDSEVPLTLLDQRNAGKKLMLITNSEWSYAVPMMSYAFDRFLPKGMTWRELFDIVIVGARKPDFFTTRNPFFKIVTEEGLLSPNTEDLRLGQPYFGGSARELERYLGLSGDEILYVGDHMFGDVWVTKSVLRWRTALIVRELEDEIHTIESFHVKELRLAVLMDAKEKLESESCRLRLDLQRKRSGYGPQPEETEQALQQAIGKLRLGNETLDRDIGPLAKASTELNNPTWGLLMRSGNDKSHLAFQIERWADIYTSRVSNFLTATPFIYLRSPRGSLPHDPSLPGGKPVTPS